MERKSSPKPCIKLKEECRNCNMNPAVEMKGVWIKCFAEACPFSEVMKPRYRTHHPTSMQRRKANDRNSKT